MPSHLSHDQITDVEKKPQTASPIGPDTPGATQKEKQLVQPGEYIISKCDLISPNVGSKENPEELQPINIIPMLDTVTIYEDISKPYLYCDISIRDAAGLRELVPIVGEEFVSFEGATKSFVPDTNHGSNPLDNIIKKCFRVYSISPIVNLSERSKLYVLHCISIEAIVSQKKKISKGYLDSKIEWVVKDIYENYIAKPMENFYRSFKLDTDPKKLIIEPTEDMYNFCFPFKSPFDIIKDLAEKATVAPEIDMRNVSALEGPESGTDEEENIPASGALYLFYETLSQFKFESLETSFKRKPKRHFVSKIDSVLDHSISIGNMGMAFNNTEEVQIDSLFDVIDNMKEGMYAAKLITHDMVRMRYNTLGYRYIEKKSDRSAEQAALASGRPGSTAQKSPTADAATTKIPDLTRQLGTGKLCSYNHDCLLDDDGGEGSRIKFTGTNMNHGYFFSSNKKAPGGAGSEPGIKEENKEQRIQKRDSQFQQLDNIKITIKVNGDSSLRVGDIIYWHAPSQVDDTHSSGADDPFLSGKYLMTKIKHVFTMERYYQEIQIRKDSLENWLPGTDPSLLTTAEDLSASIGGASHGAISDDIVEKVTPEDKTTDGSPLMAGSGSREPVAHTYYDEIGKPIPGGKDGGPPGGIWYSTPEGAGGGGFIGD
jgi:hypothetical protein